jgi:hypothetical protein
MNCCRQFKCDPTVRVVHISSLKGKCRLNRCSGLDRRSVAPASGLEVFLEPGSDTARRRAATGELPLDSFLCVEPKMLNQYVIMRLAALDARLLGPVGP